MCSCNNLTNVQNTKKKYLKNKFLHPLSINLDIMNNTFSPRDVLEGFFKSLFASYINLRRTTLSVHVYLHIFTRSKP
ncbi:hypothetical protein DKP84_11220 [Acinetobacter pittii]|nr:hypothetical protein DKP84_11220 [Acinetobacter pittii]